MFLQVYIAIPASYFYIVLFSYVNATLGGRLRFTNNPWCLTDDADLLKLIVPQADVPVSVKYI